MLMIFILICASSFQSPERKRYSLRKVVIDAGHGGHDTGCLGSYTKEKDIALAVALKLGKYIEENFPDVKVIYTRKTDVFVELHERAEIANNAKADLFICIHCNSACYYDKKAKKIKCSEESNGVETWVMGLHKSEANLEVAKRENEVVLLEKDYQKKYDGFDPNSPEANIIFSLYQDTYLEQSLHLASLVQEELKKNGRDNRGVKQAGFLVLYRTYMPGIYVETGFLSNKKEEKFLASTVGQATMANSILHAFRSYKNFVESGEKIKATDSVQENKKAETPNIGIAPEKDTMAKSPAVDSNAIYSKPKKDSLNSKSSTSISKPSKSEYYFSIQILSSPSPLKKQSPKFKGVKETNEEFENSLYKYTTGKFFSFEQAVGMQNKMRTDGFKDAFIVAYKDGKRIPVKEARMGMK
jgi:N-acetylmuramoyl-L-alanine amidase